MPCLLILSFFYAATPKQHGAIILSPHGSWHITNICPYCGSESEAWWRRENLEQHIRQYAHAQWRIPKWRACSSKFWLSGIHRLYIYSHFENVTFLLTLSLESENRKIVWTIFVLPVITCYFTLSNQKICIYQKPIKCCFKKIFDERENNIYYLKI